MRRAPRPQPFVISAVDDRDGRAPLFSRVTHRMRLGAVHFGAVLLAVALLGVAGCGRPATEAECEQILERTARLELRERMGEADAKLLDAEVNATKQAMRESMMNNCVGKRITESALECVREAQTTKELTEGCFR